MGYQSTRVPIGEMDRSNAWAPHGLEFGLIAEFKIMLDSRLREMEPRVVILYRWFGIVGIIGMIRIFSSIVFLPSPRWAIALKKMKNRGGQQTLNILITPIIPCLSGRRSWAQLLLMSTTTGPHGVLHRFS